MRTPVYWSANFGLNHAFLASPQCLDRRSAAARSALLGVNHSSLGNSFSNDRSARTSRTSRTSRPSRTSRSSLQISLGSNCKWSWQISPYYPISLGETTALPFPSKSSSSSLKIRKHIQAQDLLHRPDRICTRVSTEFGLVKIQICFPFQSWLLCFLGLVSPLSKLLSRNMLYTVKVFMKSFIQSI